MNIRSILTVLALLAFLSASTGGYLYYHALKESAFKEAEREAITQTEALRYHISFFLSENLKSVKALAGLRESQHALMTPSDTTLQKANLILDHFQHSLGVSVCYLMDQKGFTVASSNRKAPDSFVGKNYAFRPYFSDAIRGRPSVYLALGVTSGKRGIYYSYPVYDVDDQRRIGAAVIKASVDVIEREFSQVHAGFMLLTDPYGVVFVSNQPDWLYHLLWQVPAKTISQIAKTRQFGQGPWNWTGLKMKGEHHAVDQAGKEYLIYQLPIERCPGWKLIYLSNLEVIFHKIFDPLGSITGYVILTLCILIGLSVSFLYNQASYDLIRRKRVEEALRRSEKRYRGIVEDQTELICRFLPDGMLTFANEAYCRYFNKKRDELVGRCVMPLISENERQKAEKLLTSLTAEHPVGTVGHSVILSNGKTRWQQWTHRAIFDKQNRLIEFQSAGRDTTDLKRAEDALKKANEELERRVKERTVDLTRANLKLKQEIEERTRIEENLRENQERYELAVTAGRVGVWSWNLITNEISRDPILKTMLGYADHEMSNQHEDWTQHMHPEDTHRAKSQAKAYLEGLIPQYEIEYRMLHKDGSVFWFLTRGSAMRDINGIPNRMIGTDTDITALKRTEEALRESEARFRALTESAASAIFIVKGDRFCYLNPAAESVLGYSKHELISMRFWDPVHPDMRDRVKEWGLNRTLAEELPARYEIKIVDKYGTTRWVDYTATRTEYEGQPAILGTAFNITDRKRAEEMIRTSLQEKEVLLREIHHRVKNNLQIISSLLDMSRMRIKNPGAVDILADARAKIHTMALIHMQLYQSDRLNQIDMEGHIRKLTTYLSRVYTGSGQSIAVGIDASNVCLSISQAIPLALALNELISNAFKHAFKNGEPGTVEIRAARQSNGLVTIKVKDDGIGVPANIDIESADTLGLKLVRNLVRKQLVGNIFFQRDSGTEIVIEFKG